MKEIKGKTSVQENILTYVPYVQHLPTYVRSGTRVPFWGEYKKEIGFCPL